MVMPNLPEQNTPSHAGLRRNVNTVVSLVDSMDPLLLLTVLSNALIECDEKKVGSIVAKRLGAEIAESLRKITVNDLPSARD